MLMGRRPLESGVAAAALPPQYKIAEEDIRAADAKEVGVRNPAEETCRRPNKMIVFG